MPKPTWYAQRARGAHEASTERAEKVALEIDRLKGVLAAKNITHIKGKPVGRMKTVGELIKMYEAAEEKPPEWLDYAVPKPLPVEKPKPSMATVRRKLEKLGRPTTGKDDVLIRRLEIAEREQELEKAQHQRQEASA